MFSQGKKSAPLDMDKIDTLIGKNTYFDGTITAEGTIRIDGKVNGELIVAGNVIIGEESVIKGNIKSDNAHISGTVEGNIIAGCQLHLSPTAKILGDISVKNVIIDEGAIFIGNCKSIVQNAPNIELAENEEKKYYID